jgi:two-component system OmpR family sensor kinase
MQDAVSLPRERIESRGVPAPVRRHRPHARFGLRERLTILFIAAFAITLVTMFITLHQLLVKTLMRDVDDTLITSAESIAAGAADRDLLASPVRVRDLLRSSASAAFNSDVRLIVIRDAGGRVLGATPSSTPTEPLTPTSEQMESARRGETTVRTVQSRGTPTVRVATAPILADGALLGTVQTGESLEELFSASDRLQVLLIIEAVVGLLLAAGAGYLLVRRSLRPLDHVVELASDIEANDLTRRLNLQREPFEVQRLADTFDTMLDRLERSFEQQRNFVLDVSHELRTPLTALRGNIDVLLLDPDLPAEVRAQLERMSAETGRLIRLATNLLYLAQADTGKQGVMAPVELDLLCLEVVQQARTLRPGVRLRLGHEDQVTVLGDRDLLKQLLLNLVENGLTYTPAGGVVTLSIYRLDDHVTLEVSDTGVGIAPDDLPHIFQRFYRAERTRRRAAGGAGVGLAIVEWVARLHGGDVRVSSTPGAGSTFTVRLPMRTREAAPPAAGAGPALPHQTAAGVAGPVAALPAGEAPERTAAG